MILTAVVAFTYPVIIQYKRGGAWWLLLPLAAVVLLLDVLANYTEWVLIFGLPRRKDWTITARIRTMHRDRFYSRRRLAAAVQVYLDACEPDGVH